MEQLKFVGKAILAFLCLVYIIISIGGTLQDRDDDMDQLEWDSMNAR